MFGLKLRRGRGSVGYWRQKSEVSCRLTVPRQELLNGLAHVNIQQLK